MSSLTPENEELRREIFRLKELLRESEELLEEANKKLHAAEVSREKVMEMRSSR